MGERETPWPEVGGAPAAPWLDAGAEAAPWLGEWEPLAPDPAAMADVAAHMSAAMAKPAAQRTVPGESVFRTMMAVWAVVGLAGYLVWPSLADWYTTHPFWVMLGVSGGVASLLMPVVIMLLHRTPTPQLTRTQ